MATAAILRRQIEAALERRIPAALTPTAKLRGAVHATGVTALDGLLGGGLPEGALSELVGPECSGRTAAALGFVAQRTREGKVCAWIDVSDAMDPVSAAAAGVDLRRMLWVRCGVSAEVGNRRRFEFKVPAQYFVPPKSKKGLHGGGFGAHPRDEVKGMADAVSALGPRCAEPVRRERGQELVRDQVIRSKYGGPSPTAQDDGWDGVSGSPKSENYRERWAKATKRPWGRMEQAMRAADLLLQAGGFSAVVIDMGSLKPEFVSRVPLATWFRYRAAAERTRTSVLLLTQYACAKSSAELVLRMQAEEILAEPTVFAGIKPRVEVMRRRFEPEPSKVVSIRKPPHRETGASWQSRTVWSGSRGVGL